MENIKKQKYEIKILLKTATDVKILSQKASLIPRNVSLKAEHDGFIVDARSILGLYSLNLSEPITLVFDSVYGYEDYMKEFDEWRV